MADTLDCSPCAGLVVLEPGKSVSTFREGPPLVDGARFFMAWQVELDPESDMGPARQAAAAGATPWLRMMFRTPHPILENLEQLTAELDRAAELARTAPDGSYFQVLWAPLDHGGGQAAAADYPFLLKRASVAITGANPSALIATAAMPHDGDAMRALYSQEVAAYIDGLSVVPGSQESLADTMGLLLDLDPGRPVIIDALDLPARPAQALSEAGRLAAAGAALTLFRAPAISEPVLEPFRTLANEFHGDLAYDPYSKPLGAQDAWAFVRGEDLSLRVIVEVDEVDGSEIVFADRQLTSPTLVAMNGDEKVIYARRSDDGLVVPFSSPAPVAVLRLDRLSAEELGGFADRVDVGSRWQMPVEEIIQRLQAFEDAQARKIEHYEATKTMHLRFRAGQGVSTIEVAFAGDYFYRPGTGFDWAWQMLFFNGVKWRGKLPQLPLIQPEKSAANPFEIHFNKEYAYTLRGTAEVEGRDCWVIDFEPAADGGARRLFRGTLWVDREIYARVKTRALQLGLEGDVISNEETTFFKPLDRHGLDAAWIPDSYFLPVRTVGQEVQSLLNATFPVERETLLQDLKINAEGYDDRIAAAHASKDTMVRETEEGMRYLDRDDDGARVVNPDENFDSLSLVGGVYYDKNQDYPLPLAGLNYFSRDFKGSGKQLNVFFAGIMVNANLAEPQLFGSRWDAGGRLFAFFIPGEEILYRDGVEVENEAVERRSGRMALYLGRPIGSFTKLSFTYGLDYEDYGRADDTSPDFTVPTDTFINSLGAEISYSRAGYTLELEGTGSSRSDWQFWGFPDNNEYDPDQKDFLRWRVSLSKAWYMKKFMKMAVAAEYLDGKNLDRFSKYDFSAFADSSVGGYQSGLVTASQARGVHLSYGFNMAEALRVDLRGDAVWATDEATGLDNELLAGISLNGTTIGPWQTVVNFDLGYPLAGPADGFTVTIAFLKLFDWGR